MREKQIGIKLERVELTKAIQDFTQVEKGFYAHPSTTIVTDRIEYEVVQLRNAARIEWDKTLTIKVGTMLSEDQADAVARCRTFDVTIVK